MIQRVTQLSALFLALAFLMLSTGCPAIVPVQTTKVDLWEGTGPDESGYVFTGDYDLAGTLQWHEDTGKWLLKGSFTFPTGGYTLMTPEIVVAESFPEQVFITLKIIRPLPGAITTQALEEKSFSSTIPASGNAVFNLYLQEWDSILAGEDAETEDDSLVGESDQEEASEAASTST